MHLQENTLLGQGHTKCDPKFKVTQNVVQYPLHYMTYALAKFEAKTSNSLGGDVFTRNTIIFDLDLQGHMKCCPVSYNL